MIPTSPTGVWVYTGLYALICLAIFLRVFLFDRQGGDYRAAPAWLAWLLCVASGSVPLRLLFGGLSVPDPATVVMATFLLCVLLKTRGSVHHLLPRSPRESPGARELYRRFQP